MKITVLSDCRVPTNGKNAHGLGRMAYDLCNALKKRGHDVTLWAGPDSEWDNVVTFEDEETRVKTAVMELDGVYIDLSHHHGLSAAYPEHRVIDWIVDGECQRIPKHVIVSTEYDKRWYPHAQIVPCGVNVDAIPFCKKPSLEYMAFAAKIHERKGYRDALRVHQSQEIPVRFMGERWVNDWLPDWRPPQHGKPYYDFIGNALGLIHPVNHPQQLGGGRMPLEAAAMGTPAIVYSYVSCRNHVKHGVSGWIVGGLAEMVDAVQDLGLIDRKQCREWVADTHSLESMAIGLEDAIQAIFEGVTDGA